MWNGTFALLERSLRVDARVLSAHLARLGLIGGIYFSLCFALASQAMFGSPGLRFLRGIAYLDATFMSLLGIGYFSSAITEEKEEDTLGLMLMAGISPLGILLGKSGGRLWQALLLMAAQYPFMLLAITLGGVTSDQIWHVTTSLMAYMVFLAGFGLLCSTLSPRSRSAGAMMIIGLLIYIVVPQLARSLSWFYTRWLLSANTQTQQTDFIQTALNGVGEFCVFLRMEDILSTGFSSSSLSVHVVSNIVMGGVCAVLSWLLFGLATRDLSTEANTRGLVARRRAFFRFNAGRPWTVPLAWKDFHFVSGGIGMVLVRCAFYASFGVAIVALDGWQLMPPMRGWIEFSVGMMSLALTVDAAILLARSLQDEMRNQTLSTLIMLPRSSNAIVYAKFGGAMLGWLPGAAVAFIVTMLTATTRDDFVLLISGKHGSWAVIMLFVLVPHFAALVALYIRWGAVPVAFGMTVIVYFMIVGCIMITGPRVNPSDIFFTVIALIMLVMCGLCHLGVLLRVQALTAK